MRLPEQYKRGTQAFMDFEFAVTKDTFIPRPETELLVEKTLEVAEILSDTKPEGQELKILDIGTGSGNIAISLTKYIQRSKILALDISHGALLKARENASTYGVSDRIQFVRCNLLGSISRRGSFDIIVANPPYISDRDMVELPPEVLREPRIALEGGTDGLDFYREIIKEGMIYLKERGFILLEIGYDQARPVEMLFKNKGYSEIETFKDYSGIDRIIKVRNG